MSGAPPGGATPPLRPQPAGDPEGAAASERCAAPAESPSRAPEQPPRASEQQPRAPEPALAGPPVHVMDPLERAVQRVLRAGLVVSFALMAAGIVLAVTRGEGLAPRAVPLGELGAGLLAPDPAAYLSLGLVVLIATPFVRVAGSLLAFVWLHDRRFALVTAVVLAVMCVSVVIGKA